MVVVLVRSCWLVVLFQAEDGIRDLVRSRGLGDVYKRQALKGAALAATGDMSATLHRTLVEQLAQLGIKAEAVSYTHLTLPTSDLV